MFTAKETVIFYELKSKVKYKNIVVEKKIFKNEKKSKSNIRCAIATLKLCQTVEVKFLEAIP